MVLFTNVKSKVPHWKNKFIFVHDTVVERVDSDLAARLVTWQISNSYMNYTVFKEVDIVVWDTI